MPSCKCATSLARRLEYQLCGAPGNPGIAGLVGSAGRRWCGRFLNDPQRRANFYRRPAGRHHSPNAAIRAGMAPCRTASFTARCGSKCRANKVLPHWLSTRLSGMLKRGQARGCPPGASQVECAHPAWRSGGCRRAATSRRSCSLSGRHHRPGTDPDEPTRGIDGRQAEVTP